MRTIKTLEINKGYKSSDIDVWQKWKQSQSQADLNAIMVKLDPIIQNYVNRLQGPIPRDILLGKAKVLAVDAIKSYDPRKGTALSSHITTQLNPLLRVLYTHQNTARIPENITLKLNQYNAAKENLLSTLGRDPTIADLHSTLGWSPKELSKLNRYQRRDLVESQGVDKDSILNDDIDQHMLDAIYYSLDMTEKQLFEYTTGYSSTPLSNQQIMKKLNLTQSQLSYKKGLLKTKVQSLLNQLRK